MRTAALGCHVSMITVAGVLAGMAGTLALVLLIAGAVWLWRRSDYDPNSEEEEGGERRGLLSAVGAPGDDAEGEGERRGLGRRVSFWVYNAFLPGSEGPVGAAGGGYGSDGSGGSGGGGIRRVDSAESFGSGGLDSGLEERRRRVLERG
ncbi:hypothetical protein L873DRAFT_1099532 [Choiromyces venosus 120613-1]|uniref:Uncharacterized protein n=1 Tax=Choiromyces venosus 120613-1 TaxID=1336337 RepID=A0A3N4JK36_9PEZI|nr:hypothetical protein L873DRAFT_1099532 [Choiromyces venosus 120613-1]